MKFPPLLFSIIHLIICLSIRPQKFAQKIQENVTFFDNFLKFDGEEALPKLKDTEFGLILLHIRMPGMDGMEVLRQVCEIRSDIRIITITASGTIELAFEAMKLGAVDFIQKPFSLEEIWQLVSRVMDREKHN